MRVILSVAAVMFAMGFGGAPAQAQGGAFMWCQATADNGAETTTYYSAFFSAGAWEADRKAVGFKSEVEDEEISAAKVTAKCMAPADYDTAVAARNAAMKSAPGSVLSWAG